MSDMHIIFIVLDAPENHCPFDLDFNLSTLSSFLFGVVGDEGYLDLLDICFGGGRRW